MADSHPDQWRADFDAEIKFSNGGDLIARGFRLDIPGEDINDTALGELFVRHLGLLMVGSATITRKVIIQEPHKGGRAVPAAETTRRVVELSGPEGVPLYGRQLELASLVDLPGTVVRVLGSRREAIGRHTVVPYDVTGRAVLLHTGGNAQLTADAAGWLVEQDVALIGTDAADPGPAAAPLATAGVPVLAGLAGLDGLPPEGFRLHAVPHPVGNDAPRARVYGVLPAPGK